MAFIVSLVGLVRGQDRTRAILGMILGGLCVLVFFAIPVIGMLCR